VEVGIVESPGGAEFGHVYASMQPVMMIGDYMGPEGAWTRVAIEQDGLLVGWVRSEHVRLLVPRKANDYANGGSLSGTGPHGDVREGPCYSGVGEGDSRCCAEPCQPGAGYVCNEPLDLTAVDRSSRTQKRRVVGTIEPGTVLGVKDVLDAEVAVGFPNREIRELDCSRLMVPRAALERCAPIRTTCPQVPAEPDFWERARQRQHQRGSDPK